MDYQNIFERYELKYLLTREQKQQILTAMAPYMEQDAYAVSKIRNLYYDTPDYRLIRRSIEKPIYKEKLRLRSYGTVMSDGEVFVELKKKYNSIVYKRRIGMEECVAMKYLSGGELEQEPTQITREIDYFIGMYRGLAPRVFLSYEREAFKGKNKDGFRITFDENILWRREDLSLCSGAYGEPILSEDQVLMEVKTVDAIPLWMVRLLTDNHIYKTSFSKYGNAYRRILEKGVTGGKKYA